MALIIKFSLKALETPHDGACSVPPRSSEGLLMGNVRLYFLFGSTDSFSERILCEFLLNPALSLVRLPNPAVLLEQKIICETSHKTNPLPNTFFLFLWTVILPIIKEEIPSLSCPTLLRGQYRSDSGVNKGIRSLGRARTHRAVFHYTWRKSSETTAATSKGL